MGLEIIRCDRCSSKIPGAYKESRSFYSGMEVCCQECYELEVEQEEDDTNDH